MSGRGQAAKDALAEWKQGLGYRDMVERAASAGRDTVAANVVASARRREGIEEAFKAGAWHAVRASDHLVAEARECYLELERWDGEKFQDYERGLQAAFCEGYDAASGVAIIDEPTRRLRVYYLPDRDVLTINGVRYLAEMFRKPAFLPVGSTFRIVERDGSITLEEIKDEKGVSTDERAALCESPGAGFKVGALIEPIDEERRQTERKRRTYEACVPKVRQRPATIGEAMDERRLAGILEQLREITNERRRSLLLSDLVHLVDAGRLAGVLSRAREREGLKP